MHVSWNGATEVTSWTLYKTAGINHNNRTWLASSPRTGFETVLRIEGYARYVVVEGRDRNDEIVGQSNVFQSNVSNDLPQNVIAQEEQWLALFGPKTSSWIIKAKAAATNPVGNFVFWILCLAVVAVVSRTVWLRRRKGLRWWQQKRGAYDSTSAGLLDGDMVLDDRSQEQNSSVKEGSK